jgi:hypothetical protein
MIKETERLGPPLRVISDVINRRERRKKDRKAEDVVETFHE